MKKVHTIFLSLITIGILVSLLFYFVIPETDCPCGQSIKADFLHPFGVAPSFGRSGGIVQPFNLPACPQDQACYPLEPNHYFYLAGDVTALVVFFYIQYILEITIRGNLKKKK